MNRIKKIIGILTLAMFLSVLSINFGLTQEHEFDPCSGWDGEPFYGWDPAIQDCRTVDFCTITCIP
ncbi:hypothetical protein ES705_35480 [subsurface metagenome]